MRIIFFFLGAIMISSLTVGQIRDYRSDALRLKKIIAEHHIAPVPIDDKFSAWVFDAVFEAMDPDRNFFLAGDIQALSAYRSKLDDELNGKSWAFLPALLKTYRSSLNRSAGFVQSILDQPVDLAASEVWRVDTTWAATEVELETRWRLALTHEVLSRLAEERTRTDANIGGSGSDLESEPESRARAKASATRSINKILNHSWGYENYVSDLYLQTIARAFDPHSAYLSAHAVENFITSLSSEGYYFGFSLGENEKGEVIIESLNPGGPAWRSGMLNNGDIIRGLRWEGQEAIDLRDATIDEIDEILIAENHSRLEISVLKAGGVLRTALLRKEKMSSDQNIVKGFVLAGEHKIGYISLPGFYTDWGDYGGSQCANDVAKEIMKLKGESIEGLILDLRFNGGGSLMEAVAMAGIFIDAGPVGVVKSRTEEQTIKDLHRGIVYDGPLVVMVNGMSASASEFLAAALQDHQRAIIVGSKTYGKATAQRLFALDKASSPIEVSGINPGVAYASITIEKIYRINGRTAQQLGVTPHIILPDVYDSLAFRERVQPRAFPYDSIARKTYYRPLPLLPIPELRHGSEKRIMENDQFMTVRNVAKYLAKGQKPEPVLLDADSVFARALVDDAMLINVENLEPASPFFEIVESEYETQRANLDGYLKDLNQAWKMKLNQDIYLRESFQIISDYIAILNRK